MAIRIKLKDYDKKTLKELENILTLNYSNPFGKDVTIFAWTSEKEGTLNIPYAIARKFLKASPPKQRSNDNTWKFNFKLYTKEDNNQQALEDEALPILQKYGSICLFLPCSWGKTVQAISMASKLDKGGKVAVISTYTILTGYRNGKYGQWKGSFEECSNAKVFFLRKPTKTNDWRKEQNDANILIGMPSDAKHMINKQVDVLIIDEAHSICTENYLADILLIRPRYVIILTATPERDDEMESCLHLIGGGKKQQFVRKSNKPFKIYPLITGFSDQDVDFDEESDEEPPETQKKKSFYEIQQKIKDNMRKGITRVNLETKLAFLEERNKEIIDFIEYIHNNTNFKLAVVGDRVDQLEWLFNECVERDIDVQGLWGKRKTVENSSVLILGLKKSGTGFDEKAFIENWDGKRIDLMLFTISTYKIIQVLGRALRANHPIVAQMIDKDRKKWFHKTWLENKKIYVEMEGQIQKQCNWESIRTVLKGEDVAKAVRAG